MLPSLHGWPAQPESPYAAYVQFVGLTHSRPPAPRQRRPDVALSIAGLLVRRDRVGIGRRAMSTVVAGDGVTHPRDTARTA